jgi:hypothetical protein
MNGKKHIFARGAALLISTVLVGQTAFGHLPAQTVWEQRQQKKSSDAPLLAQLPFSATMPPLAQRFSAVKNSSIVIPQGDGRLKDILPVLAAQGAIRDIRVSKNGASRPVVVFIQDVHGQQPAQENISNLILALLELDSNAVVGLEGSAGMKKYANEWWDTLIGQCLFGPIYMIITWVILTLIASPGFITKNGAAASWVQLILDPNPKVAAGNQSPIELLINFALIIGLTVMALTVSKSASQRGSTMVSKFGGKLTAFAGGAVLGGSAVALRQTVGRAADRVSKTKWLQDKASGRTSSAATRWMYSGMYSGSQKAAKGSFDARNTAVGEQISKGLGTGVGINLGQGLPWNKNAGQGGIRKSQEEKRQKIIERGKVFTDREARATYAQRQASGLLTKGGSSSNKRSLFGMIGSPHRQAAATLLNERVTELQSNINQARGELNTLHRTMGFVPAPGAMIAPAAYTTTLSPAEQARYATLTGLATTPGSIASMSAEFVSTRDLINNPTSAGGLDLRNTIKQGF